MFDPIRDFWDPPPDPHRAGRDDVTTGKLFPSRGECLGLYRCVLIIFKRKLNHNSSKLLRITYIRLKKIKRSTILQVKFFHRRLT